MHLYERTSSPTVIAGPDDFEDDMGNMDATKSSSPCLVPGSSTPDLSYTPSSPTFLQSVIPPGVADGSVDCISGASPLPSGSVKTLYHNSVHDLETLFAQRLDQLLSACNQPRESSSARTSLGLCRSKDVTHCRRSLTPHLDCTNPTGELLCPAGTSPRVLCDSLFTATPEDSKQPEEFDIHHRNNPSGRQPSGLKRPRSAYLNRRIYSDCTRTTSNSFVSETGNDADLSITQYSASSDEADVIVGTLPAKRLKWTRRTTFLQHPKTVHSKRLAALSKPESLESQKDFCKSTVNDHTISTRARQCGKEVT